MVDKAKQAENMLTGGPIKRTIAGGILGATIGYLTTPENGRKLIARVDKEALKNKGKDLSKAAKDRSISAVKNLKTSASNYWKKDQEEYANDGSDEAETQVSATTEEVDTGELEELKEENQELQDRLKRLEEMMSKLVETSEVEEDEEEKEEEPSSKKNTKTKSKSTDEDTEEDTDEETEGAANKKKETKKSTNSNGKKKTKKTSKNDDEETDLTSDDDTSS